MPNTHLNYVLKNHFCQGMLLAILLEWEGDSKFSYNYDLNKFKNQIGKLILKGRKEILFIEVIKSGPKLLVNNVVLYVTLPLGGKMKPNV